MSKVIDSLTGKEFASYEEYLDHVSPVTGYRPRDLHHHGKQGIRISQKALDRTKSLTVTKQNELDTTLSEVTKAGVDEKIADFKSKKMQEKSTG